jgi:hypothetical protein
VLVGQHTLVLRHPTKFQRVITAVTPRVVIKRIFPLYIGIWIGILAGVVGFRG